MTETPITRAVAAASANSKLRAFNALVGVTALGIFLQAITAGEFVSQEHRGGWITAHNIISNVTVTVAVAAAIAGFAAGRINRTAAWASVVLALLLVVQIVIGHLITDAKQDGWIAVHVPLAFVIFGLTIWLSIRGAMARRSRAATV
jgi:heme A synthase